MTDINKKVEWSSYAKEGKMEGVNKSQIVKAIGTKDFCKSIQREIENPRETYVYTITPTQSLYSVTMTCGSGSTITPVLTFTVIPVHVSRSARVP